MYLGYINSVLNPLIYDMDFKLLRLILYLISYKKLISSVNAQNTKKISEKSMEAFVNDEFQRSLRRAIRDFTLRRSNLNVSLFGRFSIDCGLF